MRLEFLPADALGLSPLARHALVGRPRPPGLAQVIARRAEDLAPPATPDPSLLERTELVSALEGHLTPLGAPDASRAAARRLAQPDACAVLVGQQPGLFGGPLLNLFKAAHAVRLARHLESVWSRPVVPIFWIHGDDHDAAEAGCQLFLNPHLDVARLGIPGFGPSRRMLSRRPLDGATHRLNDLRAAFEELLPRTPWRERVVHCLAPRDGESLVEPQARLLLETLGAQGLVVLDPQWIRPALSRALSHVLLCDAPGALEAGRRRVAAALGTPEPSPAEDPPTALAFRLDAEGRRLALRVRGAGLCFDGEEAGAARTPEEAAAAVRAEPDAWSAGAHLRVLVQDLCLPVAAYVGGWGELSYWVELGELRSSTGCQRTPFVPRFSAFLSTPQAREAAARVPIELRALLLDPNPQGSASEGPEPPLESHPALTALREEVRRHREALEQCRFLLSDLDRGLSLQLRRAGAHGADLIHKILLKGDRLAQNRRGKDRRHRRRLDHLLWPRGIAQERALGAGPFLAAAGWDWPAELVEHLDPWPTEPALVHLEGEAGGWI